MDLSSEFLGKDRMDRGSVRPGFQTGLPAQRQKLSQQVSVAFSNIFSKSFWSGERAKVLLPSGRNPRELILAARRKWVNQGIEMDFYVSGAKHETPDDS
jgi:hypothetical protein